MVYTVHGQSYLMTSLAFAMYYKKTADVYIFKSVFKRATQLWNTAVAAALLIYVLDNCEFGFGLLAINNTSENEDAEGRVL